MKKSVQIPIKLLTNTAKFPTKAHDIDACFDLYASKSIKIPASGVEKVSTGIALNIPAGYYGEIKERSGVSIQRPFIKKAGVIDAGYTGEIQIILYNHSDSNPEIIDAGMKIAQIVILALPDTELVLVDSFEETARGDKGFGSSDKV